MEIKTNSMSKGEKWLKNKTVIPTAMRILTMDYFLHHDGAVTLLELEKHFHWADRTTLFRTLKTFEKKGILHSIQESNTTKYFLCEKECHENHHHDKHLHFHCTVCNETTCLTQIDFSDVKLPANYQFDTFRFLAHGTCEKCLKTMP